MHSFLFSVVELQQSDGGVCSSAPACSCSSSEDEGSRSSDFIEQAKRFPYVTTTCFGAVFAAPSLLLCMCVCVCVCVVAVMVCFPFVSFVHCLPYHPACSSRKGRQQALALLCAQEERLAHAESLSERTSQSTACQSIWLPLVLVLPFINPLSHLLIPLLRQSKLVLRLLLLLRLILPYHTFLLHPFPLFLCICMCKPLLFLLLSTTLTPTLIPTLVRSVVQLLFLLPRALFAARQVVLLLLLLPLLLLLLLQILLLPLTALHAHAGAPLSLGQTSLHRLLLFLLLVVLLLLLLSAPSLLVLPLLLPLFPCFLSPLPPCPPLLLFIRSCFLPSPLHTCASGSMHT